MHLTPRDKCHVMTPRGFVLMVKRAGFATISYSTLKQSTINKVNQKGFSYPTPNLNYCDQKKRTISKRNILFSFHIHVLSPLFLLHSLHSFTDTAFILSPFCLLFQTIVYTIMPVHMNLYIIMPVHMNIYTIMPVHMNLYTIMPVYMNL